MTFRLTHISVTRFWRYVSMPVIKYYSLIPTRSQFVVWVATLPLSAISSSHIFKSGNIYTTNYLSLFILNIRYKEQPILLINFLLLSDRQKNEKTKVSIIQLPHKIFQCIIDIKKRPANTSRQYPPLEASPLKKAKALVTLVLALQKILTIRKMSTRREYNHAHQIQVTKNI